MGDLTNTWNIKNIIKSTADAGNGILSIFNLAGLKKVSGELAFLLRKKNNMQKLGGTTNLIDSLIAELNKKPVNNFLLDPSSFTKLVDNKEDQNSNEEAKNSIEDILKKLVELLLNGQQTPTLQTLDNGAVQPVEAATVQLEQEPHNKKYVGVLKALYGNLLTADQVNPLFANSPLIGQSLVLTPNFEGASSDTIQYDQNKDLDALKLKLAAKQALQISRQNTMSKFGDISNVIGSFANGIPTPQDNGEYGYISKGMDSAYDGVLNTLSNFGPWGKMASGIMAINKLAGKAAANLGAGTDGVTKTDAILGSSFLLMTPIGLINGLTGKKSHELDNLQDYANTMYGAEALGGYGGTMDGVAAATKYSNKKFGGFSSGMRRKANSAIDLLNTQLSQIKDIAATSSDAFDIQNSMTSVNNLAAAFDLQGGYLLGAVHVGREGMKIENSFKYDFSDPFDYDFVDSFLQGGTIPDWLTFDSKTGIYHTGKYSDEKDPETGKWMVRHINKKVRTNPEYKKFIKNNKLQFFIGDDDEILYIPLKMYNDILWKNADFGSSDVDTLLNNGELTPTGEYNDDGNELYESIDGLLYTLGNGGTIDLYKLGGLMNVIPEGNLHARLHHMNDADNLTKKGIPVIDNNGELQAEIELNEIIFNKETTTKLEKLWKEGTDEAAIEAGKILAELIMENTDDRTGLIETID